MQQAQYQLENLLTNQKPLLKYFVHRLVEGLTGEANTVSFESTSRPGYFLCRAGNRVIIVRVQNNAQMKRDCTFRAWSDKFFDGYISFEVADEPDLWVRQSNRQLQVSNIDTFREHNDASFLFSETSYVATTQPPPPPPRTTTPRTTTVRTTTTRTTTTRTTTTTTRSTTYYRREPPIPEPCKNLTKN